MTILGLDKRYGFFAAVVLCYFESIVSLLPPLQEQEALTSVLRLNESVPPRIFFVCNKVDKRSTVIDGTGPDARKNRIFQLLTQGLLRRENFGALLEHGNLSGEDHRKCDIFACVSSQDAIWVQRKNAKRRREDPAAEPKPLPEDFKSFLKKLTDFIVSSISLELSVPASLIDFSLTSYFRFIGQTAALTTTSLQQLWKEARHKEQGLSRAIEGLIIEEEKGLKDKIEQIVRKRCEKLKANDIKLGDGFDGKELVDEKDKLQARKSFSIVLVNTLQTGLQKMLKKARLKLHRDIRDLLLRKLQSPEYLRNPLLAHALHASYGGVYMTQLTIKALRLPGRMVPAFTFWRMLLTLQIDVIAALPSLLLPAGRVFGIWGGLEVGEHLNHWLFKENVDLEWKEMRLKEFSNKFTLRNTELLVGEHEVVKASRITFHQILATLKQKVKNLLPPPLFFFFFFFFYHYLLQLFSSSHFLFIILFLLLNASYPSWVTVKKNFNP